MLLVQSVFWWVCIKSNLFLKRFSPHVECLFWTTNFLLSWATWFFFTSAFYMLKDMICFSIMQKCCKDSGDCMASVEAVWKPFTGRDEIREIAKSKASVPSLSSHNQRWLLFLYEAVIVCCVLSSGSCHQSCLLLFTVRAIHSRDRPCQGERDRSGVPKWQESV